MIEFDVNSCVGCGCCLEMCDGSAFIADNNYGVRFEQSKCLLCDTCAVEYSCPGDAVKQV